MSLQVIADPFLTLIKIATFYCTFSTVRLESIQKIPFPAVTVCSPNRGKWQAIGSALKHLDNDGKVWNVVGQLDKETGSSIIVMMWSYYEKFMTAYFSTKSDSDHHNYKLEFLLSDKADLGLSDLDPDLLDQIATIMCQSLTGDNVLSLDLLLELAYQAWTLKLNGSNNVIKDLSETWTDGCQDNLWNSEFDGDSTVNAGVFMKIILAIENDIGKNDLIDLVSMAMSSRDYRSHIFDNPASKADMGKLFDYVREMSMDLALPLPIMWDLMNGLDLNIQSNGMDQWKKYGWNLQMKDCLTTYDQGGLCQDLLAKWNETIEKDQEVLEILMSGAKDLVHFSNDGSQDFFPTIPFCSFRGARARWSRISGSDKVYNPCLDFKPAKLVPLEYNCFTFEANEDNADNNGRYKSIGADQGLTLFLDGFSIKNEVRPVRIIIHEPGVAPDKKQIWNQVLEIKMGFMNNILFNVVQGSTTADFDGMDLDQRNCLLLDDNVMDATTSHYSMTDCLTKESMSRAFRKCGCKPWYINVSDILEPDQDHKAIPLCNTIGMECFHNMASNQTTDLDILGTKCRPACSYSKYAPHIAKQVRLTQHPFYNVNVGEGNDPDRITMDYIYNRFSLDPRLVNHTTWKPGVLASVIGDFGLPRIDDIAVVNINYGDPIATVITQDAKVTFADKLANIGGTFGIFLGLSFVGIWDLLIIILKHANSKIKLK